MFLLLACMTILNTNCTKNRIHDCVQMLCNTFLFNVLFLLSRNLALSLDFLLFHSEKNIGISIFHAQAKTALQQHALIHVVRNAYSLYNAFKAFTSTYLHLFQ